MAKKNKIEYGEVSLSSDDLDFDKGKIRITTMIDMAVYDALKAEAKKSGAKYQSILNRILLDHYFTPKEEFIPGEMPKWVNEIGDIKKRLKKLEKQKTA